MRLLLVLLVAGCVPVAMPPSAHMTPDPRREDRPYKILVDDYTCDKACKDRIANGLTLLSP